MKLKTHERISRRGDALRSASVAANFILMHDQSIGPALAGLDAALTELTFTKLPEAQRDDLAMTLCGFHARIDSKATRDMLLSLLGRLTGWKEQGTLSFGPRRRLHDLEFDLLNWREPSGGTFDPLAADDEMNSGFNGNRDADKDAWIRNMYPRQPATA
jgi:hypothetical protein